MLRRETKARARALQILYAWEVSGRPPVRDVVHRLAALAPRCARAIEDAEPLALAVLDRIDALDGDIAAGAEHWRMERIGVVEKNVLRIALYELAAERVPPKVAINEAVRLAHWFGGERSAPFVNGILDGIARRAGRL